MDISMKHIIVLQIAWQFMNTPLQIVLMKESVNLWLEQNLNTAHMFVETESWIQVKTVMILTTWTMMDVVKTVLLRQVGIAIQPDAIDLRLLAKKL